MTFDGWWRNAVKAYEVPRTAPFFSLAKTLASIAWSRGFSEGCVKTGERLRAGRGNNDTEAGSETV